MSALRMVSAIVLAACASVGCAQPRFALRPVITRDGDDRWIGRIAARRGLEPATGAVDNLVLRPLSHAALVEVSVEARNVNALDEVPDSTWFTNRALSPAEAAIGPCEGRAAPQPPFTVRSAKLTGTTPGVIVLDATGRRFAVKIDPYPEDLPELNTAADAIVTRIYWAVGFNSPCNVVGRAAASDFVVGRDAYYLDEFGARRPFDAARVGQMLARGVRLQDGSTRVSLSLFVDGDALGPWPVEGVRDDDPNDAIPHEQRRELRGERFLAAWVNHWDSREQNSLDTFVHARNGGAPDTERGYVRHWFIDFSDALGSRSADHAIARRLGYQTYLDFGEIVEDVGGLGLTRRPWDDAAIDPRAPNLGYFGYANFDPAGWTAVTPLPRFAAARDEDLAWMARRIAGITPDHVREIITTGRFSARATEQRLLEVLLARRERILRWAFARRSPLADVRLDPAGQVLSAVDLAISTGQAARPARYTLSFRSSAARAHTVGPPVIERDAPERLHLVLPRHFAADGGVPDADATRYATLDIVRTQERARTTLRAHFYDLGPSRGYVLVGIERP